MSCFVIGGGGLVGGGTVGLSKSSCGRCSGGVRVSRSSGVRMKAEVTNGASPVKKKPKKTIGGVIGIIWGIAVMLWAIILIVPMAILHPLVRWRDDTRRRVHDYISRWFFMVPMFAIGVRPRYIHRENLPPADEAVVYVANHQSYLDIFCFGFIGLHHKFVSKIEILRVPIIGTAMQMKGDVALRRGNRKSQLQTYRDMLNTIKNGNSLVIFPEGTRSETGKMRKFQSGAFKAAKATGAKVVPLTIVGTREAMPNSALLPLRRHKIAVEVHPAIDPKNLTEEELSATARAAINSGLPEEYKDEISPAAA
ncbi:hypothetical protein NDN08_003394 [Rhodosorus marinus]|uniref:Phospholipid/glycerol acyltransferase domain-containing protein n=1 Tax=Rhodosorus marinus TaxID=101924 RepID=A0AAV8UX19_9RHOD|nr:hypothetical protein NDN08_003394 [Rhodosorus marinus]